jgi:N-acetylglutamate synthase-like GNAT family acetyltransferase
MPFQIRPAQPRDVRGIAQLVDYHARQGHLLPRSEDDIRHGLDTWVVAVQNTRLLGCGSLYVYNDGLTEVRSLAVEESGQGRGIGSALLTGLKERAMRRGVHRLFALTRSVPFFEREGFQIVNVAEFPEKVWRDCALCPLRQACDETAVALDLNNGNISIPSSSIAQGGSHGAKGS